MLLNASGCLDGLTAPDVARSLDAFVTKTVTPLPRDGNAPVRIAETDVGMLNSIGLANPGIDRFLTRNLPQLAELGVPIWVSVGGFETDDYADICSRLDDHAEVSAIELNVSCPNVETPADSAAEIVSASRLATRKPLWAKLSPAVPDIAEVARAAQASGADGLSLVNTIRGLKLDERTLRPVLGPRQGGLSGPALKPIAALQKNFLNALAVDECSVGRAEVAQKTTRRRNFEQTMVAGKELIFGKVKMRVLAASDQKRIVLIEGELLPVVRAGQNSQSNAHLFRIIY